MLRVEPCPVSALWPLALALWACTPAPSADPAASAASATAPAPATASAGWGEGEKFGHGGFPVASGPRLAIVAGQGVGAIRLGASVATVERLMAAPCDEKTPTLCRYVARAVEFELNDQGKVKRIRAHRQGRKAGGRVYGLFNGAIPPDLMFGMIPAAIQQYLGPPEKVIENNEGAAPEAFAQHVYKGLVLEWDKLPNGRTALGGARIPD
ncbi:MAG: hypothetical protein IPM35_26585 [Myxococcales bacterium]|nr:hypothetical protein [Myxococcales bacterium]